MIKNTVFFRCIAFCLFVLFFIQNSWSADALDHEGPPAGSPQMQADVLLPLPYDGHAVAPAEDDVEDPEGMAKARRALEKAKRKLGLDKLEKNDLKSAR